MATNANDRLFERARAVLPGGVNSPVRAFTQVGGAPLFFERGVGPYLFDTNGKCYVDYVGSWGALINGHAHPEITDAIQTQLRRGLSFGAPTDQETELAEKIIQHMPSIAQLRFVNSGTEATMTAIRLARAYTQRDKIIKFSGCYHGHSDALLVDAGSGALTCGVPSSAGIPKEFIQHTLVCPYNDLDGVKQQFKRYPNSIAAIIVEPIAGNMGFVLPLPEFLSGLRTLCDDYGALLIFDEVMTGFRVGLNGAQGLFNVVPDLTTLGKIIGGGLPVGALGGKKNIMQQLAPLGPVYQAGTLSGNPITVAAGLANLRLVEVAGFYESLSRKTCQLTEGLEKAALQCDVPFSVAAMGAMFGFFFDNKKVVNFRQAKRSHSRYYRHFFHAMLQRGIYLAPSPFESGFVSSAHTDGSIEATVLAAFEVFSQLLTLNACPSTAST